jgi:hypothetical protein
MPNKGNYLNLAVAAAQHAGNIHQLQVRLNNASPAQAESVYKFWAGKIARDSNNLNRRAGNLGLGVNRFRKGTREYYSTLANLAMAKFRNHK